MTPIETLKKYKCKDATIPQNMLVIVLVDALLLLTDRVETLEKKVSEYGRDDRDVTKGGTELGSSR